METRPKHGEVVRLKSGGPAMTVELVFDGGGPPMSDRAFAWCIWFNDLNPIKEKFFVDMLESAEPPRRKE